MRNQVRWLCLGLIVLTAAGLCAQPLHPVKPPEKDILKKRELQRKIDKLNRENPGQLVRKDLLRQIPLEENKEISSHQIPSIEARLKRAELEVADAEGKAALPKDQISKKPVVSVTTKRTPPVEIPPDRINKFLQLEVPVKVNQNLGTSTVEPLLTESDYERITMGKPETQGGLTRCS